MANIGNTFCMKQVLWITIKYLLDASEANRSTHAICLRVAPSRHTRLIHFGHELYLGYSPEQRDYFLLSRTHIADSVRNATLGKTSLWVVSLHINLSDVFLFRGVGPDEGTTQLERLDGVSCYVFLGVVRNFSQICVIFSTYSLKPVLV